MTSSKTWQNRARWSVLFLRFKAHVLHDHGFLEIACYSFTCTAPIFINLLNISVREQWLGGSLCLRHAPPARCASSKNVNTCRPHPHRTPPRLFYSIDMHRPLHIQLNSTLHSIYQVCKSLGVQERYYISTESPPHNTPIILKIDVLLKGR